MRFQKNSPFMVLALISMMVMFSSQGFAYQTQEEKIRAIATEAYIYTYPMVLMDLTCRQMTNIEAGHISHTENQSKRVK